VEKRAVVVVVLTAAVNTQLKQTAFNLNEIGIKKSR